MRRVSLLLLFMFVVLSVSACSRARRGGGGGEGGDGNIPLARPGGELADINFDFDSSALTSQAQMILRENAKWLLDNPGKRVTIEGHCDERGTVEYNLALGERRARSAYDFLRSLGVKADQLSTVSYGEEIPLDPGHNEEAWARNRRAHFSVNE